MLAKQGKIQLDAHKKRWLVLEDGTRYSDLHPNQEIFISEFGRYEMQLPDPKNITTLDPVSPEQENNTQISPLGNGFLLCHSQSHC